MQSENHGLRTPIVVLLEPSGDQYSYSSKFVPLVRSYFDLSRFIVYLVGSSGLRSSAGSQFAVTELPLGPVGHRGAYRFLKYAILLALSSLFLVKAIKTSRARIVVTMAGHCYTGFVVALIGRVMMRKTVLRISEPTRVLLRRNNRPNMIYAVAAWTEKVSLSLCDRIFSVRDMSDYYNIDVRKTAVIDQGVDLESIEQSVPDLRHPESVPLVVNVGRLDSEKNLNVLIESVGLLANKRMRIKCLLVGWGPELEKLRMQVANASLNDRIQFLGRVPPERVPSILKTCDVFVLPSENEGVPAAVLEAMACRVPVIICLRSGPFSDSVKKSGAAMIVDCNAFAIANAIESILSNSDFRNGLRRAGVDFVASMYDNRVSRETFTRFLLDLDSSEVSGH